MKMKGISFLLIGIILTSVCIPVPAFAGTLPVDSATSKLSRDGGNETDMLWASTVHLASDSLAEDPEWFSDDDWDSLWEELLDETDYPDWYFDDGYIDEPGNDPYETVFPDEWEDMEPYEGALPDEEEIFDDSRWWDDGVEDTDANPPQAEESDLLTWSDGLGSAQELDGNIVVVSIFLNDGQTYWDFSKTEDQKRRFDSLQFLRIATAWIRERGEEWEKDPSFFYNWEEDPALYYEVDIETDVCNEEEDPSEEMADIIEEYIDVEELKQRYESESVVFIAFVNTPESNTVPSYTVPYDDSMDWEEEIVYLLTGCDGEVENPATYAHEILHTFGAPDLYTAEFPSCNYNIDQAYVSYCEENHANEIMMTTYDVETGASIYDHISNELTDITAYYIGWTNDCEEVNRFHLQPSQHILQDEE